MSDANENLPTVSVTRKRKLSTTSEAEGKDEGVPKRVKSEDFAEGAESTPRTLDLTTDGPRMCDDDQQVSTGGTIGETETFYLYGDVMNTVFEYMDSDCIARRKSAIHLAWKELEEREATSDGSDEWQYGYAENVVHWMIAVADEKESRQGPRAQKLVHQWEGRFSWKDIPWWYEVFMQRQEPEGEDDAALEVVLDRVAGPRDEGKQGDGTWWITGFKAADEAHPALEYFAKNMPDIDF